MAPPPARREMRARSWWTSGFEPVVESSIRTGNGKQRGRLREIEEHGGLRRRLGCAHDVDPAEREPLLALVRRRLQRGDERFDLRRIPRGQPLAKPGELRLLRVAMDYAACLPPRRCVRRLTR